MRAYMGLTDLDWYRQLSSMGPLDEVNFWQPGGKRQFRTLQPGDLFLFKLHAPHRAVVGGGFFAGSTLLPVSLAWEAFGEGNGVRSLVEMRRRIERYRRVPTDPHEDYTIGCILLAEPFFLSDQFWVDPPSDWHANIVQGKTYDLQVEPGRSVWDAVQGAISVGGQDPTQPTPIEDHDPARWGEPSLVRPRLGQGSFRVLVTDAYERRCAVTGERVLPVLEAAHIRPYASGGEHRVDNGLLLRSDLHTLFDRGYVTVTTRLELEVSRRIRDDFANGRNYYALQGTQLRAPSEPGQRPSDDTLRWHNDEVFRG